MNWQEVVILLRYIFAYADVQIVVYTFEENGVYPMSVECDAEFYADDAIERYKGEFFLENRELETDFTKESKYLANRLVMSNSQSFARKVALNDWSITIFNTSQRNFQTTSRFSIPGTQILQMKNWYSWLIGWLIKRMFILNINST